MAHTATGMARQDFDLALTRYDERGGRATFYATGMPAPFTLLLLGCGLAGLGAHCGWLRRKR